MTLRFYICRVELPKTHFFADVDFCAGTPVVFLRNDDDGDVSSCRFDGLLDLLNVIRFRKNRITDSPLRLPLDVDSVRNSAEYRKYADSLIEKCTEFCR